MKKDKIRIFIDYPLNMEGEKKYKGLSMPQLIFDAFAKNDRFEIVRDENAEIDVIYVFSGGSQYAYKNQKKIEGKLLKGLTTILNIRAKIDFDRYNARNKWYEERLQRLIKRNPNLKIVHRLDGRYRELCKFYGYDKTVRWINEISTVSVFQNNYNINDYRNPKNTIFGEEPSLPVIESKSHVIENFVDINVFRPEGERFSFKGKIKILHVAATGMTRKGLGELLEFAHLLKSNDDIHFYLVGRQNQDPVYGKEIEKLPNVHYIGFCDDRDELAKYYRSCDILLFPTINDCSPNTVIEAMACGLAVLAHNSGGVPEMIMKQDLAAGGFIEAQNPIYSLKVIIENLDFYRKNALKIIDQYHSERVCGQKYIDLTEGLFV